MGIFDRLATLLKSNINDLISKAENPEKMLDQIVVDMQNQLARAKQQVAAAIADEKRLKDQFEAEYKQSQDWEAKAMLAVKEGRDDLAKQALLRQETGNKAGMGWLSRLPRIASTSPAEGACPMVCALQQHIAEKGAQQRACKI
jgi:hypothetical protein